MITSNEIAFFNLQIVSNYAGGGGYQNGFIHLYDRYKRYIGHIGVIKNEKTIPENRQHTDGTLAIYYNETESQSILETLRNKRPVLIKFNTKSKWAAIETIEEPITKEVAA
ncbi:hypothetical protein [Aquimarina pacifica]|uniref:hypothetical protein n=1 Tax=Aquimarina pacifica TaxID=1296415 RepID=UPI000471772D|nr:hypothetical protein [Aquimarina pacifica]